MKYHHPNLSRVVSDGDLGSSYTYKGISSSTGDLRLESALRPSSRVSTPVTVTENARYSLNVRIDLLIKQIKALETNENTQYIAELLECLTYYLDELKNHPGNSAKTAELIDQNLRFLVAQIHELGENINKDLFEFILYQFERISEKTNKLLDGSSTDTSPYSSQSSLSGSDLSIDISRAPSPQPDMAPTPAIEVYTNYCNPM